MEESGAESQINSFQDRKIVRRKNARQTVGRRSPSGLSRAAGNSIRAAVAAAAVAGGGLAVISHLSDEGQDNGAIVTFAPHKAEAQELETAQENVELFDTVFHDLDSTQKEQARQNVEMFKTRILAKQDYQNEHLVIPLKYQQAIENTAKAYGISTDTLMGLIGTENGGGTDITNPISGATGVAQFMPDTARQYGLIVNGKIDQRKDPILSIDAAGRYLRDHKAIFGGDEGLAVWSYHAGVGNVFTALRVYFQDTNNIDIGDYGQAIVNNDPVAREDVETQAKKLIAQDKLDISKLLSNRKVKEFTTTLDDYSETYPSTVVAMSQILKDQVNQVHDLGGGLKVSLDKTPRSSPLETAKP